MVENDMLPAIVEWLRAKNLKILTEIRLGYYCDVVGVEFHERTARAIPEIKTSHAIELKLADHKKAFQQALYYTLYGGFVWIAMPDATVMKMRQQTLERLQMVGIGLLAVDVDLGRVAVISHSIDHGPMRRHAHKKRWNYLVRKRREVAQRVEVGCDGGRDWVYSDDRKKAE